MSNDPAASDAHRVRTEAAAWLQKHAFWDWSAADEAEFDRWLSASPSHHVAYLRVKAIWERTERLSALRRPFNVRVVPDTRPRKRFIFAGIAVAAILFGLVGGFAVFDLPGFGEQTFTTAIGDRRIITLSDGSRIELNTNSVLRLGKTHRQAWLDQGEAYFDIVHDAQRPFNVLVAGKRVEDLGTKFVVRTETGKLTVGLFEGKASLKASQAPEAAELAVLTPGDVATATAHGLTVTTKTRQALRNALSWRQNMLVFSNAPLPEVVAQLNRYNHRKVVIADSSLAQMKIDASIPTNGVDAFVRVAKNYLGLRVETRDDEIIISR
ncbi:MAG TPA: FecR domain-containing protein [Rhizomicrobium sp.]|nr:FecR domain-containing protein [Rhizomicrobium sp.]